MILRRYIQEGAYEAVIDILDLDGLGYHYPSILDKLYSIYHTQVEMDLASWKFEECRQNGMSCRDYAEWIKYLARLATPPNANAEEQRRREAL